MAQWAKNGKIVQLIMCVVVQLTFKAKAHSTRRPLQIALRLKKFPKTLILAFKANSAIKFHLFCWILAHCAWVGTPHPNQTLGSIQ